MSNDKKRSFKIITHLVEVLSLEEEEFEELDVKFESQFNNEFKLELEFLIMNRDMKKLTKEYNNNNKITSDIKFLKGLHKSLVLKTHPDITGNSDKEFKAIQAAYECGDIVTLFRAAHEHDIEYEIDNKNKEGLTTHISLRRQQLNNKRQTVKWMWGTSNQQMPKERENILKLLKVDMDKFKEWKKSREG